MPCRETLSVLGYGWMQVVSGVWERYFIRSCTDCRKLHIDKLAWIDPEYVWCMNCFSQDVEMDTSSARLHYRCLQCNYSTEFELEPDEAD